MGSRSCPDDRPALGDRVDPRRTDYQEQYLFLLEFYVHSVTSSRLATLNRMFSVPTSVTFQFLDFRRADGVVVTPVDPIFEPRPGLVDDRVEHVRAGRSVLFALDERLVVDRTIAMVVTMLVRKRMPREVKPDVPVGVARLDLTGQFAALRKEMIQGAGTPDATAKSFDGEVPLLHENRMVGFVDVYVRMSAFGQTIVTEFEVPLADKRRPSYVFTGDKRGDDDVPSLVDKYRVVESETDDELRDGLEFYKAAPVDRLPCVPCGRPAGAVRQETSCDDFAKLQRAESSSRGNVRESDQQHRHQPGCGKMVVLKVSGLLDADRTDPTKPSVTVTSDAEATRPGDASDPEHDVFVLRIGKKGLVGADEKSDIQLEMRTPKGPERRPPLRSETREMQTEAESKAAKKKKGKKK